MTFVHVLPSSCETWTRPSSTAGPEDALLLRRLGEGEDRAVHLDAGVVAGDRAAGPLLLVLVVAGQVAADRLPRLAAVAGAEQHVGGVVEHLRVVRREHHRGGPLEAVLHLGRRDAGRVRRPGGDVAGLAGAVVVPGQVAAVLAGVDDVRVVRVGHGEAGLAAADGVPVAQPNADRRTGCCSARWPCPGPACCP